VYDAGSPLNRQTGVSLVGTQWVAELYVGINEDSMGPVTNSISRFRNSTTSSANKGKWATFTVAGLPNDPTVLPYPYGTTVTLSVKVWDYSKFSTYEDAVTGRGLTGTSDPFLYSIPSSGDLVITDAYMEGLRAFSLGTLDCMKHRASATAQLLDGAVATVTVTDAGCGYTNAPAVIFQGGGGNGATA